MALKQARNDFEIVETHNGIVLKGIKDFDARDIFECGQCFRWDVEDDGSYTGIAFNKVINVKSDYKNKIVEIRNTNLEDFNNIWFNYFDLKRNYGLIKETLSHDSILKEAIAHAEGLRILKQDIWETLISYIISANNRIPMISRSVNLLSQAYGRPIEYNKKLYYSFPTADELFGADLGDIKECKAGFRCKYIKSAVDMVKYSEIELDSIIKMNAENGRQELMKIPGVGPKVADCILLFSMQKYEVYPVDVWVKRVTEHFYLNYDAKPKEIHSFAKEKFGDLAGFAQEYLFYYARSLEILKKTGGRDDTIRRNS